LLRARCKGTFQNYLGHVKLACQLAGLPTTAFADDRLRRASLSIEKRTPFLARQRMFIRLVLVRRLVRLPAADETWSHATAMLFLVSYAFLLRLPSEALPMVRVREEPGTCGYLACALSGTGG